MSTRGLRSLAPILLVAFAFAGGGSWADEAAEAYKIPADVPDYIRRAVESPARSAEHRARDVNRKPAELLALSGVKPGDRVVEFAAFGQYFTTLLSDIVGPNGMVYMYDLPYTEQRAGAASRAFVASHPNAKYEIVDYNKVELPQNVDVVFNVLYYHDLPLNNIDTASLNKRIYDALKPGGIFFIVDHNAAPGSGTRDTKALHRIDPEVIRKEVTAAGFELVEDSKLLARPEDDHTKMVFAAGMRGLTDQSVLKFRKPARKAAFANGYPVAPTGLADQPLPEGPFSYRTAEQQDIRVSVFARGLEYPYSLAFLPSGELLVTERAGRLRIIRNGVLDPKPISGGPASRWSGKSGAVGAVHGYMTVVVHPRFNENRWIYFAYTKPLDEKRTTAAVARARLGNGALSDVRDVYVGDGVRGAVTLAMTPDAMLWIGTAGDEAQDPKSHSGKVLRLHDDGRVPKDNPFVGKEGYRPEIYTLGHRSSMGLTVHPGTGEVWLAEMGPNGGDEINVLKPGRNYGWPLVSLGRTYPGPWQASSNEPTHQGYEPPVIYWMPAISVSGLTFYTGDKLPKWQGDLFVGGLRTGEIPGTGHLDRVLFNEKMEELRRECLLLDLHQRIRDVKQGPDGLLYVATDEPKGAILRIEPAG